MYKSIKTMTQALQEARAYRDSIVEDKGFSSQQIKMAYGILNDPRYKGGNYSGAFKAIEKIAKGLASHPDVANALKRANEELEEKMKLRWDKDKEGWYDKKGRRRYLSIGATNAIMRKKLDHAIKTGDWTDFNKEEVSLDERSPTKRELDSSELINLYQIKNKDAKILDRIAELQKKLGVKNEELETGEQNDETV